jgi:serine-type D-Ala-D-Ala carboxypeptidase
LKKDKSDREKKGLPKVEPRSEGISSRKIRAAWSLVRSGAEKGAFAGAVGLVTRNGKIVFHDSCGYASIVPKKVGMRRNSIFDVASLTKAIVTTTSIMSLMQKGKISLNQKVCAIIPDFENDEMGWKSSITVEHLLTHTSGLPAWSDLYLRRGDKLSLLKEICSDVSPSSEPGAAFTYSDLGFILLGRIIEVVTGTDLDSFAIQNIFEPLGMKDTRYNPSASNRMVAMEFSNWRGKFVSGEVHDENAYAMSGVSGHAGLFSTAADIAIFCQSILGGRSFKGVRILSDTAVRVMSTKHEESPGGYVGLGWWIKSESTPNIGKRLSPLAFGHNGYTGVSVWIDPQYDLSIILLTNRIHPVREGDPLNDKSVGIMMSRKFSWGAVNQAFQDAVIDSLNTN